MVHRREPDAAVVTLQQTDSVVFDGEHEDSVLDREGHGDLARAAVSHHVRQRLGGDPVGGCLARWSDLRKGADLNGDVEPRNTHAVRSQGDGTTQPEVVHTRWTQAFTDVTHLGDRLRDAFTRAVQEPLGGCVSDEAARRLHLQPHSGERRPEAVVQLPSETPSLSLAGGDEGLSASLELLVELQCCQCRGGLVGDMSQDLGVPRVESALARA